MFLGSFGGFDLRFELFVAGSRYTSAAGPANRAAKRMGVLDHRVMASSVAATLRKKSTRKARGVYGVKNPRRDWRTDHSRTATWVVSFDQDNWDGRLTNATDETALTSPTEPPFRPETKSSFCCLRVAAILDIVAAAW